MGGDQNKEFKGNASILREKGPRGLIRIKCYCIFYIDQKPKKVFALTWCIWMYIWKEIWTRGPVMNPPDRRQAREAPSPTYSNWTFYPQQLFHRHKIKAWYIPASGSSINSIGRLVSNNPLGEEKISVLDDQSRVIRALLWMGDGPL